MLLVGAIALIAIGPKQLPEVARTVGRFLNQLRDATTDFKRTVTQAGLDVRSPLEDVKKSISEVTPQIASHLDFKNQIPDLALASRDQESRGASASNAAIQVDPGATDPRQLAFEFEKKES